MALKPTIYKFSVSLSDFERNRFEQLNLTLAQHPSETLERMLVRLLAFCINSEESLQFTKGLSSTEEPDLWMKNLHGDIELWIEVGEPSPERIKKVCRRAKQVKVYPFNSKSSVWWSQEKSYFETLKTSVDCFSWDQIKNISPFIERTNDLSLSIHPDSLDVCMNNEIMELAINHLQ